LSAGQDSASSEPPYRASSDRRDTEGGGKVKRLDPAAIVKRPRGRVESHCMWPKASRGAPTIKACALFAALVLLAAFAASSALGAGGLRRETWNAGRRGHGHTPRVARQAGRRRVLHRSVTAANVLLGDGAVEPLRGSLAAGRAEAFPFKAGASSAAGAVHVYIDARNRAERVLIGLYADAGGRPGLLLAAGSLSGPKAGAWDTATIAPVQLVPGAGYWLVVLGGGGTLRIREGAGGSCKAEMSVPWSYLQLLKMELHSAS
jgi:hypothetical protein